MKSNLKCINVSKYFRNNNGFKNQEYVLKDIKLEIKENDFTSGALWKFAQSVGSARFGAVTHPGARKEKKIYSDI